MKRIKSKTQSALMTKIVAYQNNQQVGTGWLIIDVKGKTYEPTLSDDNGRDIPEGNYNIVVTDEQHLVVITERIQ